MIVRNRTLPHGEIDGELMALDAAQGEVFGLDPIGTRIWTLAREPVSIGGIVDALVPDFDAPRAIVSRDVRRFLADAVDAGMFERTR